MALALVAAALVGFDAFDGRRLDEPRPPWAIPAAMLPPSESDPKVFNVSGLREKLAQLEPEGRISLHLMPGAYEFGDTVEPLEVSDTRAITLWSDGDVVLDGQASSAIFRINRRGKLLLQGLVVTGGYTENKGGGCFRILNTASLLVLLNVEVYNCTTSGGGGGAINVLGGDVEIRDSVIRDSATIAGPGDNARGGAIGVQDGKVTIYNVTISNTFARADSGQANGGGSRCGRPAR